MSRLKHVMKLDDNTDDSGQYRIRSLYFDNYTDTALQEKLLGVNKRSKYRIRYYNDNHEFIRLEKKMKVNGLTAKTSVRLSKKEVLRIVAGDIEWLRERKEELLKDLYIQMTTRFMKPRTLVDYTREAYIYAPGNVRVTIDSSIRTGLESEMLFEKGLGVRTMHENQIVLEVKWDEYLPTIIQDLVQLGERRVTSISKYALCRQFY